MLQKLNQHVIWSKISYKNETLGVVELLKNCFFFLTFLLTCFDWNFSFFKCAPFIVIKHLHSI